MVAVSTATPGTFVKVSGSTAEPPLVPDTRLLPDTGLSIVRTLVGPGARKMREAVFATATGLSSPVAKTLVVTAPDLTATVPPFVSSDPGRNGRVAGSLRGNHVSSFGFAAYLAAVAARLVRHRLQRSGRPPGHVQVLTTAVRAV